MRLTSVRPAIAVKAGDERGFTMPAVLGAMLVVMLLSVAAIAAASGDIHLARNDQDDKNAQAAAEAGVNDYLGNLNSDSNYWSKCNTVDNPAVSQKGATGSTRRWKRLPGDKSEYSIELLPAPGFTACSTTNPASMLYQGNVRVRSTGRVVGTDNYRTVTATYRRAGFLDFLYYTNYENQDRSYYQAISAALYNPAPDSGQPALATWLADKCERHYSGAQTQADRGRKENVVWKGTGYGSGYQYRIEMQTDQVEYNRYRYENGAWRFDDDYTRGGPCGEIQFASADEVKGPFHTNDDFMICGSPEFGRSGGDDAVETSGEGWRRSSGSGCDNGNPIFRPSLDTGASQLDPPATNQALENVTQAGYKFTGNTKIVLAGANMTVTNNGSTTTKALPTNGVVYVEHGTCSTPYNPLNPDARPAGCGNLELSGNYSKDLTIATEGDIIVTGNVTMTANSDAMLGLISNSFVRVSHAVSNATGTIDSGDCDTPAGGLTDARIDAAILTLTGSFTVDRYWCGGALGTLTVNGAIAQQHRGVVGKGSNGYIKNYNYDVRMAYRSPPFFLDPLQSSWRILRQGEQSPPQRG